MVFRKHRLILWGVIALLAGVCVALCSGTIQTRLVQTYLAAHPEWGIRVEKAELGLGTFRLSHLTLERGSGSVSVEALEGVMPLGSALLGRMNFERLSLTGVEAQWQLREKAVLNRPGAATGEIQLRLIERVRERMRFPVPMRVGEFSLDGRMRLASESGHSALLNVSIRGGDFAPSRTGTLTVSVRALNLPEDAFVTALEARTEWRMHMVDTQAFDQMTLVSDITARGPRFPGGTHLKTLVNLGLAQALPTCEVFASVETQGEVRPLIHILSEADPGAGRVKGTWKVDLSQSDLTPYALGFSVPPFSAMGSGGFSFGRAAELSGELDLVSSDIGRLAPALSSIHEMKTNLVFDIAQDGTKLQLRRFRLRCAGAAPVAELEVLHPLTLLYSKTHYTFEPEDGDWVRLSIHGLPWEWLGPLLGKLKVEGTPLSGVWMLGIRGKEAHLRQTAPLVADIRSVRLNDEMLAGRFEVSAFCSASVLKEGWQVEINPLQLHSRRESLASLSLKVGQSFSGSSGIKTQGVLRGDLRVLKLAAPRLFPNMEDGVVSFSLDGSLTRGLLQVGTDLRADHLQEVGGRALPDVVCSGRMDLHDWKTLELDTSVILSAERRKTDLAILGKAILEPTSWWVDAAIQADSIETDDLYRSLRGWLPFHEAAMVVRTSSEKANHGVPWGPVRGKFKAAVKRLVFPSRGNLGNFVTQLTLTADALNIDHFQGTLGEGSDISGKGEIDYIAGTPEPYHYAGIFQAKDMDLGPLLTLSNPDRLPLVDGRFDVLLLGKGSAAQTDRFFEDARADITLTSRGGRFHGFDTSVRSIDVEKLSQPSSRLGSIVDFAASVIGRSDKRIEAAQAALKGLTDIAYDQVVLDLRNRPGVATEVREFSLISPELRLLGTGSISSKKQTEFVDRPLRLSLDMRVRGEQGERFRQLGLLEEFPDSLGYFPLKQPLGVEGSLYDFGNTTLVDLIGQSLAR